MSAALLGTFAAPAQDFALDWFTIDGGGGTSSGGTFALNGTIGQPDPGKLKGRSFTLLGGFWGGVEAVHAPDAPYLYITRSDPYSVIVSWKRPATGWVLEENDNLSDPTGWDKVPGPYESTPTYWYIVMPTSPTGIKFYQLHYLP